MTRTATSPRTAAAPYVPFEVEVVAVRRLSPSFVRVTLGGADLVDMDDGGALGTRDTRIKVVIPTARRRPCADVDPADPDWYRTWLALDPSVRGHVRTYTARSARLSAAVPEIDIDFVLHLDEHGAGGPATVWAANAQPGQHLTVIAPHRHHGRATGIEWRPPTRAPGRLRVLIAGDETAAPAIAAILESLPDQQRGQALIEVPTAADVQDLLAPPAMSVTFLVRDDRPRGERLQAAVEDAVPRRAPAAGSAPAVSAVDVDTQILWETPQVEPETGAGASAPFYAWVAGEAGVVRDIRRSLVRDHGIPRHQVAFMGYWRQGRAEG